MGYTQEGSIKRYWPDDDEKTIYLPFDYSFSQIKWMIEEKWGDCNLDDINISSEYIHTDCLTYDRYDPMDYTNFIVIRKNY